MDDVHADPDGSLEFQAVNPICELVGKVRELHRQVGSLLSTSDALIGKHDWKPMNNVAVMASRAVDSPTEWSPAEAHRFYRHENPTNSGLLPFVSVLLINGGSNEMFPEPLLSAGCIDYGAGKTLGNNDYFYSYCRCHVWAPEHPYDGTPVSNEAGRWIKEKVLFQRVTTFAVPLASVNDSASLAARIVDPLLAIINRVVETRSTGLTT